MKIFKKISFIIMSGFILFTLCGCGNETKPLIGTWKLESNNTIITLENGEEIILNPEFNITENNLSKEGTCSGSGCNSYVYSTEFDNLQVYVGNLCYELADDETLKQVKCYSDNISGFDQYEDQTEHDIVYKKVVE